MQILYPSQIRDYHHLNSAIRNVLARLRHHINTAAVIRMDTEWYISAVSNERADRPYIVSMTYSIRLLIYFKALDYVTDACEY